jgi:SWI/SNF-related matrix-associated actin-dependent regulator of chromatin subfamily A-like protein 1
LDAIYVKPSVELHCGKYNPELINRIKNELNGRRWNSQIHAWEVPPSLENLSAISEMGFTLDKTLTEFIEKQKPKEVGKINKIPGLKCKLLPFQPAAVEFIESRNGRALVADEVGLGKTVETMAWLQLHKEKIPIIIVTPASLKYNWQEELLGKTSFKKIEMISGNTPYKIPKNTEIIIINYDILESWAKELLKLKPKILVGDEIHIIRNLKKGKDKNTKKQLYVKRSKAFLDLGEKIPHIIGLTGTPIYHRPKEIYNIVNLINPLLFPNHYNFLRTFCGPKNNGFGWTFDGATNTDKLHKKLTETVMIRRTKEEVLKDLPEKIITVIPVDISNMNEYIQAENNLLDWLEKNRGSEAANKAGKAQQLAAINILKQLAGRGKTDIVIEMAKNIIEQQDKIVIFCHHRENVQTLKDEFGDSFVYLTGETPVKERQEIVNKFQKDKNIKGFVGTTKAGGVGLTLTAACTVLNFEYEWSPMDHDQAGGRVHRISQTRGVNVIYLVAKDTIEVDFIKSLDIKSANISEIIDGKKLDEGKLLKTMFENMKKRREKK